MDAVDRYQRTALHRACEKAHVEVARLLVEHDANVAVTDVCGRTPLHWACEVRHFLSVPTKKRAQQVTFKIAFALPYFSGSRNDQFVRDKTDIRRAPLASPSTLNWSLHT